jgi:ABC-2 type transport system permease protein
MRSTLAVAKREIFSFFVSPVAYFVISGYVLLAGYFFFNLLSYFNLIVQRYAAMMSFGAGAEDLSGINLNQAVVEPFYGTLLIILVFMIPLLTMRCLAEERRRGTFEMLITSPLSVASIVVGKFLGVAFVLLLMNLCAFVFPALLIFYGDPAPEMALMFTGLLAVLLCSFGFAAIALAVSAFTENQVVAGVTGIVVLLLFYVIHAPGESLGGSAAQILEYISPVIQAREMLQGVISLKSIVYFLSLIFFGIFLSQRALDAERWR